jgi:MFS family permease
MSDFALSLYLYEKSRSLYFYSYFSLFIILPEILFSPVLGHYIDKFDKKKMMLIGHAGAGLASIFILLFLQSGYENLYGYLALIIVSSLFNALVGASLNVLVGAEIHTRDMKKATSFIHFGIGMILILAPAIAAYLLDKQGIAVIFYIDIVTFCLALVVIASMHFSKQDVNTENKEMMFLEGIKQSYRYLKKDELLWLSLILFALIEFSMSQVTVLITPIILSISTKSTLGIIMSIAGVGMLAGTIVSFFVKIKNDLRWINIFAILQALIFLLAILNVGVIAIAVGAFLFMLFSAMLGVLNYAYWQERVEQKIKGRVFGLHQSVIMFAIVLGYIASAPMSHLMQTLLSIFPSVLHIIGSYLYPEIRLLFIVNAFFIIIVVVIIHRKQRETFKLQSG